MIPILYDSTETDFTCNGIGFLTDALSATVTEERNGAFECTVKVPAASALFPEIQIGRLLKVKPNETAPLQLFRIYKMSREIKGTVTVSAEHVSYQLNALPIAAFSAKNVSAQTAMNRAFASCALPCPFTALSDVETLHSIEFSEPRSLRAFLGGKEGSVLDTFGGEFEFDNFTVKLHTQRGTDTGVVIEYAKNLKTLKHDSENAAYTHLFPYASSTDSESGDTTYTYLPEQVIPLTEDQTTTGNQRAIVENSDTEGEVPKELLKGEENEQPQLTTRALLLDLSDQFGEGETVTVDALRKKSASYLATHALNEESDSLTVSFVQLWQTEEYKKIAPLERVSLCDTVTIRHPTLGVYTTAKVIKTVYNALKEQYDSITIGEARSTFSKTAAEQTGALTDLRKTVVTGQAKAAAEWKKALSEATRLITGQAGGYVVLNPAEQPQEILILDAPTIEEALHVWRWNSAGLGYSKTGYKGEYALAMTMDGAILADFITAGVLSGALLEADSVSSAAISQHYKTEVTNEIDESCRIVEQEFTAADEQLRSLIASVDSVRNADSETIHERLSELRQTVDNLTISFKEGITGGRNKIRNSSGLNGVSDDWEAEGTVTAEQNTAEAANTDSLSFFRIKEGSLAQKIMTRPGETYTLTFRAKNNAAERATIQLISGKTLTLFDQSDKTQWTTYRETFMAESTGTILLAETNYGELLCADFMMTQGETPAAWESAENEMYTTDVKIDRSGIRITNADNATQTQIDNTKFAILHEGEEVLSVNKDLTTLARTEVNGELTIGKGRFVPHTAGVDFVLLD